MPEELPDALKKIFKELNELPRSNQPGVMSRRIELCREALGMVSKETQAPLWGKLHDDLGLSLVETPLGSRADNIEQAIRHYKQALEVRDRLASPNEWAATYHKLAGAYLQRIKGKHADNLEEAINHYKAALEVRIRQNDVQRCAMTRHNLARAYARRICGKRAENLEQALEHCKQALEVFAQETPDHDWAQAQNTLGEIYLFRIRGVRKKNIERAIRHFELALKTQACEDFPEDHAAFQNNLAAAYTERLCGVRADNLEQAIQYATYALEVRKQNVFPERWAETEHNLGKVYRYRVNGDPAENIEQAIGHFQQALQVRTRTAFPEQWADTQNGLGNAYLGRIHGEHAENIAQALSHFQQALVVHTRETFPEAWAQAQSNLGIAHLALISDGRTKQKDRARYIEKAIEHYELALQVRTREEYPKDWAETHNNLAGAYTKQTPDEPGNSIEKAIHHHQEVLKVYTRDAFPQEWAGTQHNLGIAFSDRIQGVRAENVERAIAHYQQALKVYTDRSLPEFRLRTARALGNLAFEEQRWELARDTYAIAFATQELLMQASFSRAGKQTELAEVQNLPARAAYVHVRLNQLERAVEVMEQGRAQLLRESLEHRRRDLEQLPALGFGDLYHEYKQATEQYNALQKRDAADAAPLEGNWIFQMEQALEKVQAATAAIRETAGRKYPEYRYFLRALSFEEIQRQARERPVAYLSATTAGGLALIVTGQGVQTIDLPELNQAALQKQIWRPSDEEIDQINAHLQRGTITEADIEAVRGGYFSTYALWSLAPLLLKLSPEMKDKLFAAWQETLVETTRWLWDMLMGSLMAALKECSETVTLIPAGQLAFLPLHAAWTADPSEPAHPRYVLDEMSIAYAPSVHTLWQASLAAGRPALSLMAVDNPDGTLTFSDVPSALAACQPAVRLPGATATRKAVMEEMQKAHVLHFSTHGRAGWENAEQARLKLADGYLTLPDIFELDLNQARLAVLSACETGIPGLELIDEMIGLPAGLLQAGVPGVVGSLWSVNEGSTALLMAGFYRFWRQGGKTPLEALRQAQRWLRDNLYESPYYWAAFTYTGV